MNKIKLILCGSLGNIITIYDFAIYQYMSQKISENFFPESLEQKSFYVLLLYFLTALIARPLGGLFLGSFADSVGRKKAFEYTILISSLSTGLIGCIPSYQYIGYFSTILLICLRFLQGFAVGGEYPISLAFVTENTNPNKRGLLSGFCVVGNQLGLLTAMLMMSMYKYTNHDFYWRGVFAVSFLFGAFGYWLRKQTITPIETLAIHKPMSSIIHKSLTTIFCNPVTRGKSFALAINVLFGIVPMFCSIYVGADILSEKYVGCGYLMENLKMFGMAILIIMTPVFAYISDKIGRKVILSHSMLALPILCIPYIMCLHGNNELLTYLVISLFAIANAAFWSVSIVLIIENFDIDIRCTMFGLLFSIPALSNSLLLPFLSKKILVSYPLSFPCITGLLYLLVLSFIKHIDEPLDIYNGIENHST